MKEGKVTKLNKKRRAVLALVLIIALGLILSFVSFVRDAFWTDTDEAVLVDIPEGVGISQISLILEEEGVIDHRWAFRIYEKLFRGGVYHSGVHKFYIGMSYAEVFDSLEVSVHNAVTVTIPEGYELWQIAQLLEDKEICTKDEFYKALDEDYPDFPYLADIKRTENRLEGYLFPDTYEFTRGQAAKSVVYAMLKNFHSKVYGEYIESGSRKSLDEIVIMASIIEREAANDEERGKISSVFYNRLEIGMKLQSCATVQYIIKERKKILSNSDIKIDSPYNTYMYEGLPAGPIASPGVSSVKAAINPEETDFYYFAATADGSRNVFSKTGEEHMQTVKELQK